MVVILIVILWYFYDFKIYVDWLTAGYKNSDGYNCY